MSEPITGGCQCGAVRYRCDSLGRASICHCRMCQKAFGGFYGPLVTGIGFRWTRGAPAHFRSSNKISRGFCAACGTPLTYDWGGDLEISIGSLDDPEQAPPTIQVNPADKLSF
ncbi:MAG: GFA family protein, partial [Myxococcales bacterium]|nr:GFA family protein [Myxococcales bacterium]